MKSGGAGAAGGRVVSGAAAFGSEQTRVTSRWSDAGAAGGRVVSGAAAFGSEQTRVTSRWSEQLEKIACVSDLPLAPCMPAWRACGISCPFISLFLNFEPTSCGAGVRPRPSMLPRFFI